MEFVPLLPTAVEHGDAGPVPIQADGHHTTSQSPVEDKDGNDTRTSPDAAMTVPAQQRMVLPRVRLDDYYPIKVPSPRSVSQENDTTDSESSDDRGTPPPPPIRLDDAYAILAAQSEDDMEIDAIAPDAADVADAHIEVDPIPTRPERKKHKAMSAAEQKMAIELLRAKLKLFPLPQVQFPQPQASPAESHTQTSPQPATSAPATVVKQRQATPELKTPLKRRPGRPSGPRSNKAMKAAAATRRKSIADNLSSEVMDIIQRLQKLGEPFHKDISEMTSIASAILDKQKEDIDEIATQLVQMEESWRAVHDEKRKEMVAFFVRYGVIPIGSMS